MDVEIPASLAQVRSAHPDLGELVDRLAAQYGQKLFHQATQTLHELLKKPPFSSGKDASAGAVPLLALFEDFIKPLAVKLDKVQFVLLLATVCRAQPAPAALELLAPFEASLAEARDAKYLWRCLKAEKLTLAEKYDEAKDILSSLGTEIENAYEVDALIQSNFYRTQAMLFQKLKEHQKFYKSSNSYLSYTPYQAIPEDERAGIAFDVGVAALIAPNEFEFGELLQQEILKALEGSPQGWIMELLKAFGEGRFDMFDQAMKANKDKLDAVPLLKDAEPVLKSKMSALALMELCFRKPKKQRRLTFPEISEHCRVTPKEIELLVMKAMCEGLIKGKIDEIASIVIVTWVKPRILDNARIDLMRERTEQWAIQTGLLLEHLEEMTPELLVA